MGALWKASLHSERLASPRRPESQNQSYNGFRAMAFLMVFLFHCQLAPFASFGYLGVQAFFVLSGFLITPILLKTKENRSFGQYYANFIGRRALRIFPLFYFYLGLLCLMIAVLGLRQNPYFAEALRQVPYAASYVYNFFRVSTSYVNNEYLAHFWSLTVEEQFYLLWPFIIFATQRRHIGKLLSALIIAGPAIRYLTAYVVRRQLIPGVLDDGDVAVYVLPFSYIDAFATGALFSMTRWKALANRYVLGFLVLSVLLGCAANRLSIGHWEFGSLGYLPFMSNASKYVWGYTLLNICFGLVLNNMSSHAFFPRLFEHRLLAYLGRISYGLYVYHFGVLHSVKQLTNLPWYLTDALALALTVAISALSFHLFEQRLISLKDKLFPARAPARMACPALAETP